LRRSLHWSQRTRFLAFRFLIQLGVILFLILVKWNSLIRHLEPVVLLLSLAIAPAVRMALHLYHFNDFSIWPDNLHIGLAPRVYSLYPLSHLHGLPRFRLRFGLVSLSLNLFLVVGSSRRTVWVRWFLFGAIPNDLNVLGILLRSRPRPMFARKVQERLET